MYEGFLSHEKLLIYVNREERGRSAAHGDACRAAEALFASSVVEMGAWDVCEAVGTVAVAHRGIVPRRWPRGHFWDYVLSETERRIRELLVVSTLWYSLEG